VPKINPHPRQWSVFLLAGGEAGRNLPERRNAVCINVAANMVEYPLSLVSIGTNPEQPDMRDLCPRRTVTMAQGKRSENHQPTSHSWQQMHDTSLAVPAITGREYGGVTVMSSRDAR
jgi:hypothetical protein